MCSSSPAALRGSPHAVLQCLLPAPTMHIRSHYERHGAFRYSKNELNLLSREELGNLMPYCLLLKRGIVQPWHAAGLLLAGDEELGRKQPLKSTAGGGKGLSGQS